MNVLTQLKPQIFIRNAFKKTLDFIAEARPVKPNRNLFSQAASFSDFLLVEDSFLCPIVGTDEMFTIFMMKDGALGAGFWLTPMAHELLTENEMTARLESLAEMLSQIKNPDVSLQMIFDAEPDLHSDRVVKENECETFAKEIAAKRFEFISKFACQPKYGLRLFKRRVLFTMRIDGEHPLEKSQFAKDNELNAQAKNLQMRITILRDLFVHVKAGCHASEFKPRVLDREECLAFLRDSLHSLDMRQASQARHCLKSAENVSLAEQTLYHNVEMTPYGIGMENNSWQMASLLDLPETTSAAVLARLLSLKMPHRIVVNFRPVVKSSDLDSKRYLLKHAEDAYGLRQVEDISAAQMRMTRGESLMAFSMHFLMRNEQVKLEDVPAQGAMRAVLSEVTAALGCLFIEENLCAPLVFAATLPFQNSKEICGLVARDTRLLSLNLVSMLPVYGGFKGSKTPMIQMISRAGERIHLNPRDANGASHLAVLGGSGAGKSFSIANMAVAFMSEHPKAKVFIIDKKTSYTTLAWLAAENGGASFLNPPQNFPNIFSGVFDDGIDEERLPSIVNILLTAISLLSPKAELSATHTRVLSDALRLTFAEKARQSENRFDYESGSVVATLKHGVSLPRLSEVVNNLSSACDALQFSSHIALVLAEYLSPFIGAGPYSKLFDCVAIEDTEHNSPLLTLCDLDSVSGDPILLVLTVQSVILEILRRVKPSKKGTPPEASLLIIEEVGVLASESPALVAFIRDAWKTMRKFGVTCVGVTNEVSDYTDKPGPKEIWNVSPNKLILTQNHSAITEMETRINEGRNGLVPSLYHCELLRSLKMSKGEYSEAFWMGEKDQGTYIYVPTGFDYWCAASDPTDLFNLKNLSRCLSEKAKEISNPVFHSVALLADKFPAGVKQNGELRILSEMEMERLISEWVVENLAETLVAV